MANLVITAANVAPSSGATRVANQKAGGTALTQGMLVYSDVNNLWQPLNALGTQAQAGLPIGTPVGIVINAASPGQYVTVVTNDPALTVGATLTPGIFYGSSATPGAIAPLTDLVNTGDIPLCIGSAINGSTTVMNFSPIIGGSAHA